MSLKPQRNAKTKFITMDDGRSMIYIPRTGRIKKLNVTGTAILKLCDGNHSLEDIAIQIKAQFEDTEESEIKSDIISYINVLKEEGILYE
jgi:hypothetical protein